MPPIIENKVGNLMRTLFLGLVLLSFQAEAKTYSICADSYERAKLELASMIHSSVSKFQSKEIISQRESGEENVISTIAQTNKVESHLDLVDIELSINDTQKCAKVDSDTQVAHTKALIETTKTYTAANLPKENEKKAATLDKWLNNILSAQHMMNVFGKDISIEDELELATRYKTLSDLHTETLLHMDALVYKGCDKNRSKALHALDQEIFTLSKRKEEGFFDSLTSLFENDDMKLKVMLFSPYIKYRENNKEQCAYIIKSQLLTVANKMRHKLVGFQTTLLPKAPKKSKEKLENWLSHVDVTYTLMEVFKNDFNPSQLQQVQTLKANLNKALKDLKPQYIMFQAAGATDVKVKLNGKNVALNEKMYLPEGVYSYIASASGFCEIKASITLDKLEDEIVEIDFFRQNYPTVLFVSDIDFIAMVDGISVKPNTRTEIKRCNQEVPYLVKSSSQSYQDSIFLRPGAAITKEFDFLNKQELEIFSDAKTKRFTVKNDEKISDSLTSYASKKLIFRIRNKPESGSLMLEKSGHFVYSPEQGFVGKVNFDYIIENGNEKSPTKVAIIDVSGNPLQKPVPATTNAITEKVAQTEANSENVDQEKFEAFLFDRLQAKDVETLKKAKQQFPQSFDTWWKKMGGK